MLLSNERLGEIAVLVLQDKVDKDGIMLRPSEVRRDVANKAKALGLTIQEAAEFMKVIIDAAYFKTMKELDAIAKPSTGFVPPAPPSKMVKPDPAVGPAFTPPSSGEQKE